MKKSIKILLIIFIIIILLVSGYFIYKNIKNKKENEAFYSIKLDNEIFEVEDLNDIINDATFVNDRKEDYIYYDDGSMKNLKAKIEGNKIIIETYNNTLKISSIKDPVSISTFPLNKRLKSDDKSLLSYENSSIGYMYVLNKKGQLYYVYYCDLKDDKHIDVRLLDTPKIVSYSVDIKNLYEKSHDYYFVVGKGEDGKYYTNYDAFPVKHPGLVREIIHIDSEKTKSYKEEINRSKQLISSFPKKNDSDVKFTENNIKVKCEFEEDFEQGEEYDEYECYNHTATYKYKDYTIELIINENDDTTLTLKDNNKVLYTNDTVKTDFYPDTGDDQETEFDFMPKISNGKLHFLSYNPYNCYFDEQMDGKSPYLEYKYIDLNSKTIKDSTVLSLKQYAEGSSPNCKK